jgi:hypothetical protein
MKLVATFNDSGEAYLLRAHLEGSGLTVFVRDDHTVSGDLGLSNAFGGVKVEVPDEDYAAAVELLAIFSVRTPPTKGGSHTAVRYVRIFFLMWLASYIVWAIALVFGSPSERLAVWFILLLPCACAAGLVTVVLAIFDK